MESYNLIFKPSVKKDFQNLPREVVLRVMRQIENLKSEPFPHQVIKLSGHEKLYRIRVGDYRIAYEVDTKERQVLIHYVRHRRLIYRSLR